MKLLLKIFFFQEELEYCKENSFSIGYNRREHLHVVNDVVLVSLLLPFNKFTPCYSVSVANFEQINAHRIW